MRPLRHAARTALLLVCLCAAAVPAWAGPPAVRLAADFDGDGRHDLATLDRHNPALVQVWLSTTGATSIIRARVPLVRIVATDLDGDQRSELIATGSTPGLQIWSRPKSRFHHFGRMRPHRVGPTTLALPCHRKLGDQPLAEHESAVASDTAPRVALVPTASLRAPAWRIATTALPADVLLPPAPALHALTPRPPPTRG